MFGEWQGWRAHGSRLKQEHEVVRISLIASGAARTHMPGVGKLRESRGDVARNWLDRLESSTHKSSTLLCARYCSRHLGYADE